MTRDMKLNGFGSREELRNFIVTKGAYSREENERIFTKWFSQAPRYLFRAVNEKYGLTEGVLCDVGCAYGANLVFCRPGSYGIEIEEYEAKFARSIGLTVYQRNVVEDDFSDLPPVDIVWNSAVLEHVDSPHIFLRKLHLLLKPGGLLALYVPIIPPLPFLKHLPVFGQYFSGHLHGDHINAFIPRTLRFFCERAGFETIEVSAFYPNFLSFINRTLILVNSCVYIGRKKEDWEYPANATRRKATNRRGFVFISQEFPNFQDAKE